MPLARCNGIDLAYDVIGPPDAPLLVMLMGVGCQRTLWAPEFCERLAARGLRVVRVDNRDVGESARLEHLGRPAVPPLALAARLGLRYPAPYSLADMAHDTLGLLDALGARDAHLLGGSMGGMIAQEAALLEPERVRSLSLWMTTPSHRPLPAPPLRVALRLLAPHPRDPAAVMGHRLSRLRALTSGVFPFDEPLARELVGASLAFEDDRGGFERQLAAVLTAPSRAEALASLRCPTLVMHGTRDPLIPIAHGEALAKMIPGARFERFEGAGHEYPKPLWPQMVELIAGHCAAVDAARNPLAAREPTT